MLSRKIKIPLYISINNIDKMGYLQNIFLVIIANFIPTTEQIGGITLGLSLGLDPLTTLIASLTVNCLLFFPIYFGLKLLYDKIFSRIKLFQKYLERTQKKGKPYIDKYGVLGLTVFVALPSPLTGTYTASLLAWLMNLDWKKSFLAIAIGSFIGALVIFFGYFGILNFLKILFSI
jgi:uncharacterized membrane protein